MKPEAIDVTCPSCGERLFRQRRGEWTLATPMLKVDPGGSVRARCPGARCDADVPVPFLSAAVDIPAHAPQPRIAIRRVVTLTG